MAAVLAAELGDPGAWWCLNRAGLAEVLELLEALEALEASPDGELGEQLHNVREAMRELEREGDCWRCVRCGSVVRSAPHDRGVLPALFGPCRCAGWDDLRDTVAVLDAYEGG